MSDSSPSKSHADSFFDSFSLEMLMPLDDRERHGLLTRWDDVAVHVLHPAVRELVRNQESDPEQILCAFTDPGVVADAAGQFIEEVRAAATEEFGTKSAEISLARAGLLSEIVPTLEELGTELKITRERVRQLERPLEPLARAAIKWDSPLALSLQAWFTLHPRLPLTNAELLSLGRSIEMSRCLTLALRAMDIPHTDWLGDIFVETEEARRALDVLLDKGLLHLGQTARGWSESTKAIAEGLPGIEKRLDLPGTLRRIGRARDIGPGIDGRIVRDRSKELRRVARKVVTYLTFRASPISIMGLADVIRQGLPPFEVFAKPDVSSEWIEDCVLSLPDSLEIDEQRMIWLAPAVEQSTPPGRVGTLHSILQNNGEPIRMQDLCDQAAASGMSRNQVGMLIHSRRAACLFMLKRGIVGLVGRDEEQDPDSYTAVNPAQGRAFLRPGKGIDADAEGALLADLKVRRSLHEQGLGLPWPFSLVMLDPNARLMVDGEVLPIRIRNNGALDVEELEPNSAVRLRLRRRLRAKGCSLEIRSYDKWPSAEALPEEEVPRGSPFPVGMPTEATMPGWVNKFVQDHATENFSSPSEVLTALPGALPRRRRLYSFHGLIALGLLQKRSRGWATVPDLSRPTVLSDVFATLAADPTIYPLLSARDRAAATWLVRAAWLTPNLGWSVVRVNDLSVDENWEPETDVPDDSRRPSAREAALMRLLETAHQAEDHILHPVGADPLSETFEFSRRYLTTLGFTRYGAVKEVDRKQDYSVLEFTEHPDLPPSGIWVLRPLGTKVRPKDLAEAQGRAIRAGAPSWGASNGVALQGTLALKPFTLRFQDLGEEDALFDSLLRIGPGLDPTEDHTSE